LSPEEKIKFKQKLKEACVNLLLQRIDTASQAMLLAQESANDAEKSSAGDKYETARAMGQLDRDMNAKQLEEAKRELATLQSIDVTKQYEHITNGAFVVCSQHSFFVAIGLGTLTLDDKKIVVLSPKAPLAVLMNGKKTGNSFRLNETVFEITDVF
jgi:hypothetical protein